MGRVVVALQVIRRWIGHSCRSRVATVKLCANSETPPSWFERRDSDRGCAATRSTVTDHYDDGRVIPAVTAIVTSSHA